MRRKIFDIIKNILLVVLIPMVVLLSLIVGGYFDGPDLGDPPPVHWGGALQVYNDACCFVLENLDVQLIYEDGTTQRVLYVQEPYYQHKQSTILSPLDIDGSIDVVVSFDFEYTNTGHTSFRVMQFDDSMQLKEYGIILVFGDGELRVKSGSNEEVFHDGQEPWNVYPEGEIKDDRQTVTGQMGAQIPVFADILYDNIDFTYTIPANSAKPDTPASITYDNYKITVTCQVAPTESTLSNHLAQFVEMNSTYKLYRTTAQNVITTTSNVSYVFEYGDLWVYLNVADNSDVDMPAQASTELDHFIIDLVDSFHVVGRTTNRMRSDLSTLQQVKAIATDAVINEIQSREELGIVYEASWSTYPSARTPYYFCTSKNEQSNTYIVDFYNLGMGQLLMEELMSAENALFHARAVIDAESLEVLSAVSSYQDFSGISAEMALESQFYSMINDNDTVVIDTF